ncbi:carbohydrate ABC transporter permease [Pseudonocardia nigra]|uniref:carbohydrate ABC transporter permease n=1 Tax=Pseudonocardia nigra TaxID=1921578 RepID=UPI001FE8127B|nr:carbohydrate ABC transporter permease [Pseudonocardia nigra]
MTGSSTATHGGGRDLARRRRSLGHGALTALTWLAALLVFFPFLWMVLTAFKQESDAVSATPTLFFTPTLDQFRLAIENNLIPYFLNSLMATVTSTAIVLALALPAAYALSIRPAQKWRDVLFFFLTTRMLPIAGAIVPIYLIARDIGALDSIGTLILLYTSMNLPLAIWMIRSFLKEIPVEVLEAARVDGVSFRQELTKVILPMIAPGLSATALLCVIFSWNEFFLAVNLTSSQAPTVPLYLVGFISTQGLFWAKLSAASVLATLPVLIAGLLAQKQLVRGLSLGAIK